jgi:hypothetical protein
MARYTVRITNDENGINAWIDQDGSICIMQPHEPGKHDLWTSEAEAKTWADKHAAELEAIYETQLAETAAKKEREEAQHAANLALVAILEKLTAQA